MGLSHPEELRLMSEDNAGARSPFRTTDLVWDRIALSFSRSIERGLVTDLSQFNTRFASWPRSDRHYEYFARYMGAGAVCNDWYGLACELYMSKLREQDKHGVIDRAGIANVDWDALLSLEETISVVNADPSFLTEPKVVVDLGAGWGRLGHVMLRANPRLAYVACDIPESLIVAQVHLPPKLSQAVVHPYSENREVKQFTREVLSSPGVRFCGTQDLDRFSDASVDLFVNVFSFQEMTMQQIAEYVAVIDRVAKGGLFYNQQRHGGIAVMTRANFPYLPTWPKVFDRGTIPLDAYFEALYRV